MEFDQNYDLIPDRYAELQPVHAPLDFDIVRGGTADAAPDTESGESYIVASDTRRPAETVPEPSEHANAVPDAPETPQANGLAPVSKEVATQVGAVAGAEKPQDAADSPEGTEAQTIFDVSPQGQMPETTQEWERALTVTYEAAETPFEGDIARAGVLAQAFGTGVRYVHEVYNARGAGLTLPSVRLDVNPEIPGGYTTSAEAIVLGHTMLSLAAQQASEFTNLYRTAGDDVIHDGSIRDYYVLLGAEEGHHYIYSSQREADPTLDNQYVTLVEYDAVDVEWHALRWQVRAARAMGMPERTQEVLRRRLEAAKQLRRARRQQPGG